MKSILKSFRLKAEYDRFLAEKSKEMGVSQAAVIEAALDEFMAQSRQWEKDLKVMAKDKAYQKEQRDLANEYYEDF